MDIFCVIQTQFSGFPSISFLVVSIKLNNPLSRYCGVVNYDADEASI